MLEDSTREQATPSHNKNVLKISNIENQEKF